MQFGGRRVAFAGTLSELGELQAGEGGEVGGLDQRVALQRVEFGGKSEPLPAVAGSEELCASDGLLYLASERNLERGFNESEADYRGVLLNAWAIWAQSGSAESHSFNLGRLGFQKVIVKRRRVLSGLNPTGVSPYVIAFTRDV